MNNKLHPLFFLLLAFILLGCMIFTPSALPQQEGPFTPTQPPEKTSLPPLHLTSETATPFPLCTPPLCALNETYHCSGVCPGGCGTICATTTPDPALFPLAKIEGAGIWLMKQGDLQLVSFDPAGERPAYVLQHVSAVQAEFILVNHGRVFFLSDTGDGSLRLSQVYPHQRELGILDAGRTLDGSALWSQPPVFSADGESLIWSRPVETDRQAVFSTSLENGESHEQWQVALPPEASGHALLPLYYDQNRHLLVYALHTFYSGMSPGQVASLYLAQIERNQVIPLVALNPLGLYAGYSAAVSEDGNLLAYLTYSGEPDQNFNLEWLLHLRRLDNGQERTIPLPAPLNNAQLLTFSPDGSSLLLETAESAASGDWTTTIVRLDVKSQAFSPLFISQNIPEVPLDLIAWPTRDWLIFSDNESTWAMKADGSSPLKVAPFRWLGLLEGQ